MSNHQLLQTNQQLRQKNQQLRQTNLKLQKENENLKKRYQNILKEKNDLEADMNKRFQKLKQEKNGLEADMNKRFQQKLKQEKNDLEADMNKRFQQKLKQEKNDLEADMNKRFQQKLKQEKNDLEADMNKRFQQKLKQEKNDLKNKLLIKLLIVILIIIVIYFGFSFVYKQYSKNNETTKINTQIKVLIQNTNQTLRKLKLNLSQIQLYQPQISQFYINQTKIKSMYSIKGYQLQINGQLQQKIQRFHQEIKNIIKIILEIIQKQIQLQNYKNVQTKRNVLDLIAKKNNLFWIQENLKKIDEKIKLSTQQMIELYRNFNMVQYLSYPPRYYLQKLEHGKLVTEKQQNNYLYSKTIVSIENILHQQIQNSIQKIQNSIQKIGYKQTKLYQGKQILRNIKMLLNTLPDEIQQKFKQSLDNTDSQFRKFETKFLDETLKLYIQTMNSMNQNIQLNIYQLATNITTFINYASQFNSNQTQTNTLKTNFLKKIKNYIQKFENWPQQKIEEMSFTNINYIIEYTESNPKFDKYLENLKETIIRIHNGVEQYFSNKQKQFKKALENFNFDNLALILLQLRVYNNFIRNLNVYLQKCVIKDPNCSKISKIFYEFNYDKSISIITNKLNQVKQSILSFKILQKQVNSQRVAQYQKLNNQLEIMNNVYKLVQYIDSSDTYKKESFSYIIKEFDEIIHNCFQILKSQPIQINQLIEFNVYYNNLIDFNSKVDLKEFDHYKDKSNLISKTLKQKIKNYYEICQSPKTEIKIIPQTLIKMKQMSIFIGSFKEKVHTLIKTIIQNTNQTLKKLKLNIAQTELYQAQITEIYINQTKIKYINSTLGKQFKLQVLLEQKIQRFDQETNNDIQEIIKIILGMMQKQIELQNYKNVQTKRNVLDLIAKKNNLLWVQKNLKKIDEKINLSIQQMIRLYKNFKMTEYIANQPKHYLQKLYYGKISSKQQNNYVYSKAIDSIENILSNEMENSIQKIGSKQMKFKQRKQISRKVETILNILPDEIKEMFKSRLEKATSSISVDEQEYISITINLYDQAFGSKNQNNSPNIQQLHKKMLKFMNHVNKHDTNSSEVDSIKENYIKQIKNQIKKFKDWNSRYKEGEISFTNINYIIEFTKNNPKFDKSLQNVNETIIKIHDKLKQFFTKKKTQFKNALQQFSFYDLKDILDILKAKRLFLDSLQGYLKQCLIKDPNCKKLQEVLDQFNYDKSISIITNKLNKVKQSILSFKILQKQVNSQRVAQYQKLNNSLIIMNNVQKLVQYIDSSQTYKKQTFASIIKKIDEIIYNCFQILKSQPIQINQLIEFNVYYNNLIGFIFKVDLNEFDKHKYQSKQITKTLNQKITNYSKICESPETNVKIIAQTLIKMKLMSRYVIQFKSIIQENIDKVIKKFKTNRHEGGRGIFLLIQILKKDQSGIGMYIIKQQQTLKGQARSIWNTDIQSHNITYILQHAKGDDIDIQQLRRIYDQIYQKYKHICQQYLLEFNNQEKKIGFNKSLQKLIKDTKANAQSIDKKDGKMNWGYNSRWAIGQLISNIFALWTLKNLQYYEEASYAGQNLRNTYLLQPHAGQIVSIMRILSIGYSGQLEQLQNNLVQIKTGQGKSVTLGVTAIVLALLGNDVSCVCYSKYLSERDYDYFKPMFEAFGVIDRIHYGTFNEISEADINKKGDIRQRVQNIIKNISIEGGIIKSSDLPKILLIDEVDVFFNQDFYGNLYNPLTRVRDQSISNLLDSIWTNRTTQPIFSTVQKSHQYQTLISRFKQFQQLIEETVKDMLSDLKNYEHDYIVHNDQIAYKQQDGLAYNVVYGYKTTFAYYHQYQNKKISHKSLRQNLYLAIKCGSFSYAQIPLRFNKIMGVTGTLNTLSIEEKQIINDVYQIKKFTFIPSAFGANKRGFAKISDVFVFNKDDYLKELRENIQNKLANKKRAVLVFFKTQTQLQEAYHSKQMQQFINMKHNIQKLTQKASLEQRQSMIQIATTAGQITFLTRVFGRGVDFICHDQTVLSNDGVHVISTFLSDLYSQQIQIMGRSARQGQYGSFSMVLKDQDLQGLLGLNYKNAIETLRNQKKLYDELHEKRLVAFSNRYKEISNKTKQAKQQHVKGLKFIEALDVKNIKEIKQFLQFRNQAAKQNIECKLMILMDGTGSMTNLINGAKQNIKNLYDRLNSILSDSGFKKNSFKIQITVYRDYDQGVDGIIQYSTWQTQPINLENFLKKITAKGGDDYEEAIQIALWHANQQHLKSNISEIILMGDAQAKTSSQISNYRNQYGGQTFWKATKFGPATHYTTQLEKLKLSKIPIHSLYLQKYQPLMTNFQQIARVTGGNSQYLDINDQQALKKYVALRILTVIGQKAGVSDKLVRSYQRRYG